MHLSHFEILKKAAAELYDFLKIIHFIYIEVLLIVCPLINCWQHKNRHNNI